MDFGSWLINEESNFGKKLIDQYGKYKVFVVNGETIRNHSQADEEFGENAIHVDFPNLIPKDEIWIEQNVLLPEREILIASSLYRIKLLASGISQQQAYDKTLIKEKIYRKKIFSKDKAWLSDKPAPEKIYVKKYGFIKNEDITVWLVHGEKVRNTFKIDWLEGGHGYVYDFVPNKEIWLENGLMEKELPYILLHEYVERTVMKYKHFTYNKAHKIASKVEFCHRQTNFSKQMALNLTKEKALLMAKKFSP